MNKQEIDRVTKLTHQEIQTIARKPYLTKTDLKKLISSCKYCVKLMESEKK